MMQKLAVAVGVLTGVYIGYRAVVLAIRTATLLWAGAQALLDALLVANPVGLIVIGIIGLIAVILGVVYAIGKANEKWGSFGEFFIEVIGAIVGAVMYAGAFIKTIFIDAWAIVKAVTYMVCLSMLGAIYGVLTAIDSLTFGLFNLSGKFDSATADLQATLSYNIGASLEEIKNPFTAGKEAYSSGVESVRGLFDDLKNLTYLNFDYDETFNLDGYSTDLLESIASDTSDISNTLKDLNDEVKYLNDIAESKYIKNYNSSVRGSLNVYLLSVKALFLGSKIFNAKSLSLRPLNRLSSPLFYLARFREYVSNKKPVRFIIIREQEDGSELFSGNLLVSFDSYEVEENAGEEGDFWVTINLKEYEEINIPTLTVETDTSGSTTVTEEPTRTAKETASTYTVKSGDTLWQIAKTELNDGNRWQEIATLNGIGDPKSLQIGAVLKLP